MKRSTGRKNKLDDLTDTELHQLALFGCLALFLACLIATGLVWSYLNP